MQYIHEQVAELESEAERLGEIVASCRRGQKLARAAVALGAGLFAATLLGLVGRDEAIKLVVSVASAIGGFVWLGSSQSSERLAQAQLEDVTRKRSELIDRLDLHSVRPSGNVHYLH